MNCPVCQSSDTHFRLRLYDDRYGYPGMFTLKQCHACQHQFIDHQFTAEQLGELYTHYYPRAEFDLDAYQVPRDDAPFVQWLNGCKSSAYRWVPENVRVLDIGCGFGQSLGYHQARGCDVYGVEADENIRRIADRYGYNVHVGLFDDSLYEDNFFDVVTLDQVIEHVQEPSATLAGVGRILKPGGHAILTTPNAGGWGAFVFGKQWINWHTPYHLHFYSRASIQQLADRSGLHVESIQTITSSEWLKYQWLHLLTFPHEQQQPSPFWAGIACGKPTTLSPRKKAAIKALKLLHHTRINHLITRLFDSLGLGDSYVITLRKP